MFQLAEDRIFRAAAWFTSPIAMVLSQRKINKFLLPHNRGKVKVLLNGKGNNFCRNNVKTEINISYFAPMYPVTAEWKYQKKLFELMEKYGEEPIFSLNAEVETIHETGHINFTSLEPFQDFLEDGKKLLKSKGVPDQTAMNWLAQFFNIVEDGRIEVLQVEMHPENKRLRDLLILKGNLLREYSPIEEPPKDDFEDFGAFMIFLLSFCKSSKYPIGVKHLKGTKALEVGQEMLPELEEAIMSGSCRVGTAHMYKALEIGLDYIAENLKNSDMAKMEELFKAIAKMLSSSEKEGKEEFGKEKKEHKSSKTSSSSLRKELSPLPSSAPKKESEEGAGSPGGAEGEGGEPKPSGDEKGEGEAEGSEGESAKESSNPDSAKGSAGKGGVSMGYEESDEDEEWPDDIDANLDEDVEREDNTYSDEEMEGIFSAYEEESKAIEGEKLLSSKCAAKESPERRFGHLSWNMRDIPYKEDYYNGPLYPISADFSLAEKKMEKALARILRMRNNPLSQQKSGVLNVGEAYKTKTGSFDVFSQPGRKSKSFAVTILVDNSGSMSSDDKVIYAGIATAILELPLVKNGVALRVSEFEEQGHTVVHHIVRDFKDKTLRQKSMGFAKTRGAGGNNFDAFSIAKEADILLSRKEEEKFLFVFSDGMPASIYPSGCDDVAAVVEEVKKKGIHVIAVAFGSDSDIAYNRDRYELMYKEDIIFCKPTKLPEVLPPILQRIIKK